MKKIIGLFTAVWLAGNGVAADWKPVPGHLMTRWAKAVAPDQVLPEYPRPQLVRAQWQNLNGLWDYAITDRAAAQPAQFNGKILVPFCVESALSGVKKPLTAQQRLWYRRTFTAPELAGDKRLLLHFGAVDWQAKILVNGQAVGEHTGGYDAFTLDITAAVKSGNNELVVSVFDDSGASHQPKGKQHFPAIAKPGGIMYTPCSGIWQTAWLETVPAAYVESLKIVPDVDGGAVSVTVNTQGGGQVQVTALDGDQPVATGAGAAGQPIVLKIPDAKLWSPDTPFLYGLRVACGADTVQSYFGMRKIALGKDDQGITRILLNGKFVFQVGFLDQGFWPDGIYTAPTDAALKFDIETTKKLGMNVARKHVKVEPDRWYYWCDKLGLLVWQDMPGSSAGKGGGKDKTTGERKDGVPFSPEVAQQFEAELKALVEGRWNHPSIIMWVVFNEGWGQYDTPRLTQWVKSMDPSRLVNNASGWNDIPCGDVQDMHSYPGPGAPKPTDGRAAVLGEFGGLGLPVPGHTWVEKTWGYRGMTNAAELTQQYGKLLQRAYELKDQPGLNAVIYTQTTDCETECNGLITYDREVVKPDLEKTAAANRGQFPPAP
ncbi:MAG: beta-galactosidase [Kiritimatiellaeota bacterium]|nr:beta-galactosidase [Kiritimatiellota bacterium]